MRAVTLDEEATLLANIERLTGSSSSAPRAVERHLISRALVSIGRASPNDHARDWAQAIMPLFSPSFIVASVTPPDVGPYAAYLYGATPPTPPPPPEGPREEDTVRLDAAVQQLRDAGAVDVSGRHVTGSPVTELARLATHEDADLAIIEAPAHEGLIERLLLGSVTDGVVHHAPCDVLLARSPARPGDVAVLVDGSWASQRAALLGLRIARAWGTTLSVHHVVAPAARGPPSERGLAGQRAALGLPWSEPAGVSYGLHAGEARERLTQILQQTDPALIAMGCRGLGTLRGALLGSLSAHIIHHVPTTLLLTKHPRGSPAS